MRVPAHRLALLVALLLTLSHLARLGPLHTSSANVAYQFLWSEEPEPRSGPLVIGGGLSKELVPTAGGGLNSSEESTAWMSRSRLVFNEAAATLLSPIQPLGTTIHFTFGSSVMLDFVFNWRHFVDRAGLRPAIVGAADGGLLRACADSGIAAVAVSPALDVWTYEMKRAVAGQAFELKSEWKYYRHHKSSFLEMGLVKAAFLTEFLRAGFSVLITDLDVVWLNGHWRRWMAYDDSSHCPLPQASLAAIADVLVSTDEIDASRDISGNFGFGSELNTGVLFFRNSSGALAVVQAWREAMKAVQTVEFINDQNLFNSMIHGAGMQQVADSGRLADDWKASLRLPDERVAQAFAAAAAAGSTLRPVWLSHKALRPCLPWEQCESVRFTLSTLPMRAFTNGHSWFNQDAQHAPGADTPIGEPVTVHFTFQFGDTKEYPHGKRQRAREAALWAVDPPHYFTEGVFVRLTSPLYGTEDVLRVAERFPEWSPQRHMHMDAPQRAAVRDLLALSIAADGVMIMPKLHCFCDRYWNFLSRCRFPIGPRDMPIPFGCPQDALYDLVRWNSKRVRFREHTFLDNPLVPAAVQQNVVTLRVRSAGEGAARSAGNITEVWLDEGTPLHEVKDAVLRANPQVRLIEVSLVELRRLCRWLGSPRANREFNSLVRYILTDSSRYCPNEDYRPVGGAWDWRNPFTAYNCTWGFHYPALFPERYPCDDDGRGTAIEERTNSTTCPRQMLCDWNTLADGREVGVLSRCNIEGYGGMDSSKYGVAAKKILAQMPGGRCPYPPGDVPGGGPGHDARGNWIGIEASASRRG